MSDEPQYDEKAFRAVLQELLGYPLEIAKSAEGWRITDQELLNKLEKRRKILKIEPSIFEGLVAKCVAEAFGYGSGANQARKELLDRLIGPVAQKVEQKTESFVAELPAKVENPEEWAKQYGPQLEKKADA